MNKTISPDDALRHRAQRIQKLAYSYEEQPKEWLVECNLCNADYFVQISHRDRYGYEASASLCANCGLVFLNPRMTEDSYRDFYASVYRPLVSAYHGREINSASIQEEQRDYAIERAKFIAPYVESMSGKTLLDIGGSTGIVATHFHERFGYECKILDPSEEELAQARQLGLDVVHGFFEEVDFKGENFDLILLCQTIDHLLDVRSSLEKIRALLSANGLFFLDIVDFRAAYLRNWSVEESIKVDHPYYLTQDSVEAYLLRAGFSILRKGYAADHLHINYLCSLDKAQPDYLPPNHSVSDLQREIRKVQNAPGVQQKAS